MKDKKQNLTTKIAYDVHKESISDISDLDDMYNFILAAFKVAAFIGIVFLCYLIVSAL